MRSRDTNNLEKKKNVKVKVLLLVIVISIVSIALGVRHHIYSVCKTYDNIIYPGVTIENVDVSGKTKEQVMKILNEKYGNEVLKKNIIIKTPGKEYKINYSQLNAKYNILETVNNTFQYGRDKKVLEKYKLIKHPREKKINLKFSYDKKYIDILLDEMKNEINANPKDATIRKVGNASFSVAPSKNGQALKVDKLKKDLDNNINGNLDSNESVIKAEIDVMKPKIEAEVLKSINSNITSFSTKFNNSPSSQNRVYNIKLSSKAIDGTLVMPGDSFSFNDVVGERTLARGYKDAPIIVGNKLQNGLGGGVCQVSSTLYNAIIRANIPSTERRNHTMPSSYVDKGLDATVSYGSLDYKFKNTLKYPIYIESYVNGDKLICNVYSNESLKDVKYDFISEVYETIPSKTSYVNDASLSKGTEVIDVKAKTGYRVNVYKVVYKNGQQISKELLYKDYYKAVNGVIRRGTK